MTTKQEESSKPTKPNDKLTKKMSNAEAHEKLLLVRAADDPDYWGKEKVDSVIEAIKEERHEDTNKVMLALGFDNDHSLIYTVSEKYQGLVIELRRKLIKDFDCHTPLRA